MTLYPPPRRRSKLPFVIFVLVAILAAGAAALYFAWPRFESAAPQIALSPDAEAVGLKPLQLRVTDSGTGLRAVTVGLAQGGSEHAIASDEFASPVRERRFDVDLAKIAGIKEGPAVLRVVARDNALWRGNEAIIEKKLAIDATPRRSI
jgi:hypothetical protein